MGIEVAGRLRSALAGQYDVVRELGRGGMARVFLARDLKHDRAVALKVLRDDVAAVLGAERFEREIAFAARLHHPHILPLFDSGAADGLLYYVMPYVEGETLRDRLTREQQIPVDDAIAITRDVAAGLAHAHSRGVVHRDIKPANILLEDGRALVADFGIARALADVDEQQLTDSGLVPGTPPYMSPEHASGDPVDGRSDVYSLACVLFEMLAGDPPFRGVTVQATLSKHKFEPPPSVEVVRPTVSAPVSAAIRKALAKVPADRFATATGFADALVADRPVPVPGDRRPRPRRGPVAALLAAAVAVLAGIAVLTALPSAPPLDARRVVVFPLVTAGADQAPEAGWDVALAIGGALEHTEPLRWIDGWIHLSESLRADARRLTPAVARRTARARGAAYYVDGVIRRGDDQTAVVLRLHDVAGDSVVAQETERGSPGAAPASLGFGAITRLLPRVLEPGRTIDLSPLVDRAPGAVALSIQGDRAYRRSQFAHALDFYQRALAEDSLLVFAAVKGAQAATWARASTAAGPLLDHAVRHADGLPERYRLYAEGLTAYWRGDRDSAVARFEAALVRDTGWAEAWMALGDVHYHLPPPVGSSAPARDAFEAALRADATFSPALQHLVEILVREGRVDSADALLARLAGRPSDTTLTAKLRSMVTCVRAGGAFDWTAAVTRDPQAVFLAAKALSPGLARAACARGGFRAMLDHPDLSEEEKWGALLGLQGVLMAEGRYAEVRHLLDSTVAAGTRGAYMLYVFDDIAGAPFGDAAAEAERLARAGAGEYYEAAGPETQWILGVWHARVGRVGRADTLARRLAAQAEAYAHPMMQLLADGLAAHVRLAAGDTAGALAAFAALKSVGSPNLLSWNAAAPLAIERITLARLQLAAGRPEAAYRTAQVFDHPTPVMYLPFVAEALRIRVATAAVMRDADAPDLHRRLARLDRP